MTKNPRRFGVYFFLSRIWWKAKHPTWEPSAELFLAPQWSLELRDAEPLWIVGGWGPNSILTILQSRLRAELINFYKFPKQI